MRHSPSRLHRPRLDPAHATRTRILHNDPPSSDPSLHSVVCSQIINQESANGTGTSLPAWESYLQSMVVSCFLASCNFLAPFKKSS